MITPAEARAAAREVDEGFRRQALDLVAAAASVQAGLLDPEVFAGHYAWTEMRDLAGSHSTRALRRVMWFAQDALPVATSDPNEDAQPASERATREELLDGPTASERAEVEHEYALPTSPGWWWCESPNIADVWEPASVFGPPGLLKVEAFGCPRAPVADYAWGGRCVVRDRRILMDRSAVDEPASITIGIAALDSEALRSVGDEAWLAREQQSPDSALFAFWNALSAAAHAEAQCPAKRGAAAVAKPAIYSVRQAIAETDLPADMSSTDAIRGLWGRISELKAKLREVEIIAREVGPGHTAAWVRNTLLEAILPHSDSREPEIVGFPCTSCGTIVSRPEALCGSCSRPDPEPATHQDVVAALRERIVMDAGHTEVDGVATDAASIAALVTAYAGTDPRESADLAARVSAVLEHAMYGDDAGPSASELRFAVERALAGGAFTGFG